MSACTDQPSLPLPYYNVGLNSNGKQTTLHGVGGKGTLVYNWVFQLLCPRLNIHHSTSKAVLLFLTGLEPTIVAATLSIQPSRRARLWSSFTRNSTVPSCQIEQQFAFKNQGMETLNRNWNLTYKVEFTRQSKAFAACLTPTAHFRIMLQFPRTITWSRG